MDSAAVAMPQADREELGSMSAKHRHQNRPGADFLPCQKDEFGRMKALSVLVSLALLAAADPLAARLRHSGRLPAKQPRQRAAVTTNTVGAESRLQPLTRHETL